MKRRNHRPKASETLTKTDSRFEFRIPDPSSSRADSDFKRKRRVTFGDVDHRSPMNESLEAHTERCGGSFAAVDAKTSEFAFFKKLKSNFGLRSESSNSKSSNRVEQNLETFESGGTDHNTKDRCKSHSFSTPSFVPDVVQVAMIYHLSN